MRDIRDRSLPPDHDAFIAAEPPTGRIIVIAPTRAACETIELALGLHIPTYLEEHHGARLRELAASGRGFGIMAGTGTGKTLAIRPIAETILRTEELKVGVVNREREATPETPSWNVIIVTTGIARRWFQDGDILPTDTLVVDEIHQTSAELELCLALGKRVGCRFIWLSATVDPTFYREYLNSSDVLEVYSFDETRKANVKVVDKEPLQFLDDRFLRETTKQKRGIGMFLPTRAGVEQAAEHVRTLFPRIEAAYYHGGEPIRVIRPFLEAEGQRKPFFLSMTAAGQSALNVRGLDTVIIDDVRFTNVVERGRNVLTKQHLGANEMLQMAGRVHGRVEGGRVFILSDRDIDFFALRPTPPEFQIAGDSERVALTCADLGVRADELDLPVPIDRIAYRRALALLERRGIVENGRLSKYGRTVEALPVERPWAELIVNAEDELLPFLAIMSAIESLHRMTREERDLEGLVVPGSDHLTAYNVYVEAYRRHGYVGEVYGLPRHLFHEEIQEWAEERGVLVKAIEDAALATASVFRGVGVDLPTDLRYADEKVHRRFAELLAQFMPFDLVIDEETSWGEQARVSKTSVCGSWGAIAGTLRFFADRFGIPRASIEGTQLPMDLLRKYATRTAPELIYDPRRRQAPLALKSRVEYFGFELEREVEALEEIPAELLPLARRTLADALARGEARHVAVKRNVPAVEEVRELWRRSGGTTPRLNHAELTAWYESKLQDVTTLEEFRAANLRLDPGEFVERPLRERLWQLPGAVELRNRTIPLDYDLEEDRETKALRPVVRLRLPEKVARTLTQEELDAELPTLDRPVRFVVLRGPRGAVRADTLEELHEILARPWSPDEVPEEGGAPEEDRASRDEREARRLAKEYRRDRERGGSRGRGGSGGSGDREWRPGRGGRRGQQDRERFRGGTSSDGEGRPARGERGERSDRPERGERAARGERSDRPPRDDRPSRGEGGERGGREDRPTGPGGIGGGRRRGPAPRGRGKRR